MICPALKLQDMVLRVGGSVTAVVLLVRRAATTGLSSRSLQDVRMTALVALALRAGVTLLHCSTRHLNLSRFNHLLTDATGRIPQKGGRGVFITNEFCLKKEIITWGSLVCVNVGAPGCG